MHHEELPLLMYLGNPPPHRGPMDPVPWEELQSAFGPNVLHLAVQRGVATGAIAVSASSRPDVCLLPKGLDLLSRLRPARRPARWTPALDLA